MKAVASLCLMLAAPPLAAHPHIFVNTGLAFIVDGQNRLTHVRVTWEYDELYSLLVTEDMGIDEDYDGVLDAEDTAKLTGFDMQWIEGYNGDLVGTRAGQPLTLSGPSAPTAVMHDGKIITTHLREVEGTPDLAQPVEFRPYDGTYYTAYEVGLPVTIEGSDTCEVTLDEPDIEGALAMTQAELSAIPQDFDMETAGLGDIGARFATKVELSCAGQ